MLPVKSFQCLKAGEIGECLKAGETGEEFSKLLVASVTGLSREKPGKKKSHIYATHHYTQSTVCSALKVVWKNSAGN